MNEPKKQEKKEARARSTIVFEEVGEAISKEQLDKLKALWKQNNLRTRIKFTNTKQ